MPAQPTSSPVPIRVWWHETSTFWRIAFFGGMVLAFALVYWDHADRSLGPEHPLRGARPMVRLGGITLVAMCLAIPAIGQLRAWRWSSRLRNGLCLQCGYDLCAHGVTEAHGPSGTHTTPQHHTRDDARAAAADNSAASPSGDSSPESSPHPSQSKRCPECGALVSDRPVLPWPPPVPPRWARWILKLYVASDRWPINLASFLFWGTLALTLSNPFLRLALAYWSLTSLLFLLRRAR
jgi:hypothetical protein